MTNDTFDTITRSAGTDRRRTMLALGAAGLATTLAGTFRASAKQSAGKKAKKKAKKKCKQQKATCVDQVTAFCAPFMEAAECRTVLLPCCEACDVAFGVICTVNALSPA